MSLPALPDGKLKLAKKLLASVTSWREAEQRWIQLEMVADNLNEQLKASTNCPEFERLCAATFSSNEMADLIKANLKEKIQQAVEKNEASHQALIAELEAQQKRFYQFRQEVEKTLTELTVTPANVCKKHSVFLSWDEVIRWTVEAHSLLCASIEAKRENLPFDSPSLLEFIGERLDFLNFT